MRNGLRFRGGAGMSGGRAREGDDVVGLLTFWWGLLWSSMCYAVMGPVAYLMSS